MTKPKPARAAEPCSDWEAIEREYRAGQLSIREIGKGFHVSHTAINKRARKKNWQRDLTAKVRETVRETLIREDTAKGEFPLRFPPLTRARRTTRS